MTRSLVLVISQLLFWVGWCQYGSGHGNAFFSNATLIRQLSGEMIERGDISCTQELLDCKLKYLPDYVSQSFDHIGERKSLNTFILDNIDLSPQSKNHFRADLKDQFSHTQLWANLSRHAIDHPDQKHYINHLQSFSETVYSKWKALYIQPIITRDDKQKQSNIQYSYGTMTSNSESLLTSDLFLANHALMALGATQATYQLVMNYLQSIDAQGHADFGNRLYWQDRGYLPLVFLNVKELYDHQIAQGQFIKAFRFLDYAFALLRVEYDYFMAQSVEIAPDQFDNHTCKIQGQPKLNVFSFSDNRPRMEQIVEDDTLMKQLNITDFPQQRDFIKRLKSLQASEWLHSSRFIDGFEAGSCQEQLNKNVVEEVVAVDLNSFMYQFEVHMSYFAQQLGQLNNENTFKKRYQNRRCLMRQLLFDPKHKKYHDWNYKTKQLLKQDTFQISNYLPLWAFDAIANEEFNAMVYDLMEQADQHESIPNNNMMDSGCMMDFPRQNPLYFYFIQKGLIERSREQIFASIIHKALVQQWLTTFQSQYGHLNDPTSPQVTLRDYIDVSGNATLPKSHQNRELINLSAYFAILSVYDTIES